MNQIRKLGPNRTGLLVLAAVGLLGLNGVFVYYALVEPHTMADAYRNPVSLVFILEAFVMVGFGAWTMGVLGLERPGWISFVVLSLVGGLAFSVPAVLLLHLHRSRTTAAEHDGRTV